MRLIAKKAVMPQLVLVAALALSAFELRGLWHGNGSSNGRSGICPHRHELLGGVLESIAVHVRSKLREPNNLEGPHSNTVDCTAGAHPVYVVLRTKYRSVASAWSLEREWHAGVEQAVFQAANGLSSQ